MILELKNFYNTMGNIVLYRDPFHKKRDLCNFLKNNLDKDGDIVVYSDGAMALYLARVFYNRKVYSYHRGISYDYGELMEKQGNLIITTNFPYYKFEKEEFSGIVIDQYKNPLIKEYYRIHFNEIYNEISKLKIDAFCDCGHSCATMAGFYEATKFDFNLSWDFVLGVHSDKRRENLWHLLPYEKEIKMYNVHNLDTYKIGEEIEKLYSEFGNVYEATWSISTAIQYLRDNPGKTVLVYVGDSFEKEGTKFRNRVDSKILSESAGEVPLAESC